MRATKDSDTPQVTTQAVAANQKHSLPSGMQRALKNIFGLQALRPGQQAVIESVLEGNDTLAIMPTGGGKSLCYQLPALGLPGMTIVVSPLIALMKDQAEKLEEAGIKAAQLNSTLNADEEREAIEDVERENKEIVFVTPERLASPEFLGTLKHSKIDLVVIDEAHCVSKWGHDFRPSYLTLKAAIKTIGQPPVLALTATATDEVIQDIAHQLGIGDMRVVNTGVYRSNLHFSVIHAVNDDEKIQLAIKAAQKTSGSGIIYAATIKAAEHVHEALIQSGEKTTLYHGQMPSKQRTSSQEEFMEGRSRIMVATNAFGMGIDKPDIRFVVHFQIPASIEAYYQESGRAGRDGNDAACVLLYQLEDKRVQQFFLAKHFPDESEIASVYSALKSIRIDDTASISRLHTQLQQNISLSNLQVILKLLSDEGIAGQNEFLDYYAVNTEVKPAAFKKLAETYVRRQENGYKALDRMVFYAQTGFCRWKVILEYFGEEVDWEHCGSCDNCLHPPEQSLSGSTQGTVAPSRKPPRPPEKKLRFSKGEEVFVAKYGLGQVVSAENEQVKIVFPDSQVRTFLSRYVRKAGSE